MAADTDGTPRGRLETDAVANMSYCRFENTVGDFKDCLEALREGNLLTSREEHRAARQLLKLAAEMVEEFDENALADLRDDHSGWER